MLELLYDMYGAEDQILSLTLAQILKRAIRETWETLKKKQLLFNSTPTDQQKNGPINWL